MRHQRFLYLNQDEIVTERDAARKKTGERKAAQIVNLKSRRNNTLALSNKIAVRLYEHT